MLILAVSSCPNNREFTLLGTGLSWYPVSMRFLLGLLAGLLLLPAGAYVYVRLGYAPVATAAPALPFERAITRTALNARIQKEAPKDSPVPLTDANLIEGAKEYREHCSVCHGLINQPDTAAAKGMFPNPPQLFKHGVTDDPVGETYWKVENGIRLTGMPAYVKSVSEDKIWKMSMMLARADKLPPDATAILQKPLPVD